MNEEAIKVSLNHINIEIVDLKANDKEHTKSLVALRESEIRGESNQAKIMETLAELKADIKEVKNKKSVWQKLGVIWQTAIVVAFATQLVGSVFAWLKMLKP